MTEQLVWLDYLTIGLYFALVLAVGLWSTFKKDRGTAAGYFLAGKSMIFLPVGASIYASNVGAPMFVGLAGTAAASGFAVTIFEWHAVYIIISLGWLFVPVYVSCGAFTMPEYLRKRYGGRRIRTYTSILALIVYIMRNISGEIYSGVIFMQQLLGWNLYLCVVVILVIVAVYTIAGGLRAVLFTDTLQTGILIIGACVVTAFAFDKVRDFDTMKEKYMLAMPNYTLTNITRYQCGMPRQDSMHIFRDPVTGDLPWTGSIFGLTILALFVWCQDQLIVQRCLSAKNLSHAKGGTLVASGLKFLSFPLFVLPGMISRILFTEEVACADPDRCMEVCQNRYGCSNLAYPLLVLRILPAGVRGLMLAALLAALMSTLTSVFNSASSIVTLDLWKQFRKKASEAELMIVGRVTVLVLVGISILWLPILQNQQGGQLWYYIAAICAYFTVPWCMAFLLGLFWKRTTEAGIFWGMIIGLVIGIIRISLDFAIPAPACGSGEPDERFNVTAKVDFLHFSIIVAIICTAVMMGISLLTKPRTEEQLHRVTWWTRNDIEEPQLSDHESEDEDDEVEDTNKTTPHVNSIEMSSMLRNSVQLPTTAVSRSSRVKSALYDWICGDVTQPDRSITAEERAATRRKMTSLKQSYVARNALNFIAATMILAITFMFGYFA